MNGHLKRAENVIRQLRLLVVDDNPFMRQLVRSLLTAVGVQETYEAGDGIAALEAIRANAPDIVVLDWEMPLLNGPELVRIVRSPGVFPIPDIPIIMLSGHRDRARVVEAAKLGVNEFLCKPVSAKALQDRMVSIMLKPREIVHAGGYYGPAPRRPIRQPRPDFSSAVPYAV